MFYLSTMFKQRFQLFSIHCSDSLQSDIQSLMYIDSSVNQNCIQYSKSIFYKSNTQTVLVPKFSQPHLISSGIPISHPITTRSSVRKRNRRNTVTNSSTAVGALSPRPFITSRCGCHTLYTKDTIATGHGLVCPLFSSPFSFNLANSRVLTSHRLSPSLPHPRHQSH